MMSCREFKAGCMRIYRESEGESKYVALDIAARYIDQDDKTKIDMSNMMRRDLSDLDKDSTNKMKEK